MSARPGVTKVHRYMQGTERAVKQVFTANTEMLDKEIEIHRRFRLLACKAQFGREGTLDSIQTSCSSSTRLTIKVNLA